ncbi:MAG: hypothetical protein KC444_06945 [Nitrosopumilus sp.]|nr:hypothetical protein [Nitrosopumilus sp.]
MHSRNNFFKSRKENYSYTITNDEFNHGKGGIIDGNFVKDAEQPVKNCFVDGELQKRFEESSKKFKIVDVQPFADKCLPFRYEE